MMMLTRRVYGAGGFVHGGDVVLDTDFILS